MTSSKDFHEQVEVPPSAKLTLTSDKGELSVLLEVKLGQFKPRVTVKEPAAGRGHQGSQERPVGPSQQRRRERRAGNVAVQQ